MTDEAIAPNGFEFVKGIEYHKGTTNILLVAPHGVETAPLDDKKTAELTREIQQHLKCDAIINPTFRKPDDTKESKRNDGDADLKNYYLDLNNIEQAEKHPTFISKIREVLDKNGSTYVFWIHGIDDDRIKGQAKFLNKYKKHPDQLHALIGYGQGPDRSVSLDKRTDDNKADSPSIEKETAESFMQLLTQKGMNTELTSPEAGNYCARSSKNMNQWFLLNGYKLEQVRSLQLEIREEGFRKDDKIKDTAKIIADAISTLLPAVVKAKSVMDAVNDEKVEKAYEKIALIFSKNYEQALMEVGQYIVRTFYGGEEAIEDEPYQEDFKYDQKAIENARNNDSPLNDSLNRLYAKISDKKAHNTPSKAWVYNAVNLVIQWHDVKKELENGFHTYRNLLLSHKISLLTIKNIPEKLELIHEVSKNDFTALSFKKRIADSSTKAPSISTLLKKPQEILKDEFLNDIFLPALKTKRRRTLASMKTLVEEQSQQVQDEIKSLEASIEKQRQYLKGYDQVKSKIEKAIESKDKTPKKKSTKAKIKPEDNPNQDWADEGINISTGCSHNCRYCYARDGQIRKRNTTLETWHIEKPRPKIVNKKWGKTKRRKLFPSIHDITPGTYEDSVKLIKNFLKPGNMLLIVSKPHPDLIEKLCDEIAEYKDQVLFRFTISATENELLKFWEPGAPSFEDRLKALQIAQEKGFETSVSIEPMIDAANIFQLVDRLRPYTTDSIWLGTMNNIGRRVKNKNNPEVKKQIDKIEAGQTPDKLKEIYLQYKEDPLIRFKGHIRQALKEIGTEVPKIEDDWRERRQKKG